MATSVDRELLDQIAPIVARAIYETRLGAPLLAAVLCGNGSAACVEYGAGAGRGEVFERVICRRIEPGGWEVPAFVLLAELGRLHYVLALTIGGREFAILASRGPA